MDKNKRVMLLQKYLDGVMEEYPYYIKTIYGFGSEKENAVVVIKIQHDCRDSLESVESRVINYINMGGFENSFLEGIDLEVKFEREREQLEPSSVTAEPV